MMTRWRSLVVLFSLLAAVVLTLQTPRAEAQFRCPPGYFRGRFGRCTPLRVVPRGCPPGYILDGRGLCVRAMVPRMCPPGYFYFRGRCIHR